MLVLVCSAVMCAGMWLGDNYLAAALTNSTAVQQQLKLVLPLVVATIMRKLRALSVAEKCPEEPFHFMRPCKPSGQSSDDRRGKLVPVVTCARLCALGATLAEPTRLLLFMLPQWMVKQQF
jgi:hypothetical protein